MPIAGFKGEILPLLRTMKARNEMRDRQGGKSRKNPSSSKFETELKKLARRLSGATLFHFRSLGH